ncbi:MAG: AAA family ATPase, partial [Muribaculaceae bacterium]|nr:AAA family ATPase [Muribaculaceae bacterium]
MSKTPSSKSANIDLDNPEFQNVWKLIKYTRNSIFMTGRAGAGKSTFLKYITENTRKRHVVLAPTGIAAVNVGGVTLHSFFKLPFKPLLPDDPDFAGPDRLRKRLAYNKAKIKLIRSVELIIIDEVSMVRADVIDFIDRILRTYTGNHREPFGGKQMLFVGDIFQLEPVVTPDVRDLINRYYPNPYFFSARVFREMDVVPIELKKIYRQRDPEFLALLEQVRQGRLSLAEVEKLNQRCLQQADATGHNDATDFSMTLATRKEIVERINSAHLAALPSKVVRFEGVTVDNFPENALPVPRELDLKVGAQIVFVKNDPDKRWVNGTIGKIELIRKDYIEVKLESGAIHRIEQAIWENIEYKFNEETKEITETVIGTYRQFPVNLAWALTIHKSQGLTFNRVNIDVGQGAFTGGQTYVALSRCTSLEGITLCNRVSPRDVFVNPVIVDFSRTYNDPRLIDKALERARADAAYEDAAHAIDAHDIDKAVDSFIEALSVRNELGRPSAVRLIKRKLSKLDSAFRQNDELKLQLAECHRKFRQLADEYIKMGLECINEGYDPTPAFANIEKAIGLAPDYPRGWIAKGVAAFAYSDFDMAIEAFSKGLKLDPERPDVLLHLGKSYMKVNDYHNALDSLLSALDLDKEDRNIHLALA